MNAPKRRRTASCGLLIAGLWIACLAAAGCGRVDNGAEVPSQRALSDGAPVLSQVVSASQPSPPANASVNEANAEPHVARNKPSEQQLSSEATDGQLALQSSEEENTADSAAASKTATAASPPKAPQPKLSPRDVESPDRMSERLLDSARYLASDELEGRGVRTEGLELAAGYIAAQFAEAGLKTDLYHGTPFHEFLLSSRLGLGSTNEVSLKGPDNETMGLELGRDFTPLSLSGSGQFNLPLVFAGYGITAKEADYDDYANINVARKAVIILRHEPQRNRPDSAFNGTEHSDHAYFVNKVQNAIEHGAAAVILCTDFFELDSRARELAADIRPDPATLDTLLKFQVSTSIDDRRIPVMHSRRAVIDRVVMSSLGRSLADLEKQIDEGSKPQSQELKGWRIDGRVSVMKRGQSLKNVAGLLEGDGSHGEETIVVGAHYDHLGRGGWGSLAFGVDDEIHNGADDNASGTAVIMEVARQLAVLSPRLPRRVLFLAFTAEERGLVGSEHYVQQPLIPMAQTIAMVNLDMVGRLRDDKLTVYGTGTAVEFDPLVDRLGTEYKFRITKKPGGYGPSDHASFYEKGVPVLHLFTGFHPDYHRPSDDYDKLNIAGMRQIARMVSELVVQLAEAESRPKPLRPNIASLFDGDSSTRPATVDPVKQTPYLGVSATREQTGGGYLVSQVVSGGPAERGGCRVGDRILSLGGAAIVEPRNLLQAVGAHKPGDKVAMIVERGDGKLELSVTLGGR